jgi:hypothetical protein
VRVLGAEDKRGIPLRHALYVDEPDQPRLRQQMQLSEEQYGRLIEMAERLYILRDGWEGKPGGPCGVAEAIERPQNHDPDHGDRSQRCAEAAGDSAACTLGRKHHLPADQEQHHGREQDSRMFGRQQ